MGRSHRRRRRRRTVWWKRNIGGMPVWLSLSIVTIALGSLGVLLLVQPPRVDAAPREVETESPAPTPTPTSSTAAREAIDLRAVVSDSAPLVVSVLGDSTGNDGNEWVALWGQHLADQGAIVTIHTWNLEAQSYTATSTFGTSVVRW